MYTCTQFTRVSITPSVTASLLGILEDLEIKSKLVQVGSLTETRTCIVYYTRTRFEYCEYTFKTQIRKQINSPSVIYETSCHLSSQFLTLWQNQICTNNNILKRILLIHNVVAKLRVEVFVLRPTRPQLYPPRTGLTVTEFIKTRVSLTFLWMKDEEKIKEISIC